MKKILIFILFTLLVSCGDYEREGDVLLLDIHNLDEALEEFDHLFIKFFAPWCDHCKEMANDWKDAARELTPKKIQLAELDCTKDHPNPRCQQYAKGYPTLQFFTKKRKEPKLFEGQRVKSNFIKFSMDNFDAISELISENGNVYETINNFMELTEENYSQALKDFQYVYVQFYKSCPKCSVFDGKWKRVVQDVKKVKGDVLVSARVDCDANPDLCTQITQFPKISLFFKGGQVAVHNGQTDTRVLVDFALKHSNQKDDL